MIFREPLAKPDHLRQALSDAYRRDETACNKLLLESARLSADEERRVYTMAERLVEGMRAAGNSGLGLDSFLSEYKLTSEEGIAIMCLAESLLRVPDAHTVDKLIKDKLSGQDWEARLNKSDSFAINAATWGLMLTGKFISPPKRTNVGGVLKKFVNRTSEPVVRNVIRTAMHIVGKQFILGETIETALKRSKSWAKSGYRFSYDMLGEAARTHADAERYYFAYENAIKVIGKSVTTADVRQNPGISIKLSALHPRYEFAQIEHVVNEVAPRLYALARLAKENHMGLTVDAEEADRLDLSLEIIEAVFSDPGLDGWDGFGLAIQSYQKRCWYLIDWLANLARQHKRRLMVRLIKGAYWDSEIKYAQEGGLPGYPVFTRKAATDVSFLACVKKLLAASDVFYPQFATHNAHSLAAIVEIAGGKDYEFQRLHGMGDTLYEQVVDPENGIAKPCRIYAPVGGHEELLAYLVRRLLENGANTSFVNRLADAEAPIESLIGDPCTALESVDATPHSQIPQPRDLYGVERVNALGIDLSDRYTLEGLADAMQLALDQQWTAAPTLAAKQGLQLQEVIDPANHQRVVGVVSHADAEHVEKALQTGFSAHAAWAAIPVAERANLLRKAADQLEQKMPRLMALLVREAGKTLPDAVSEVREAVDFCRYYALQAEQTLSGAQELPGPTGEYNELYLRGRGLVVCISPWNFPLAIFTGQLSAALVAGNTVIAKPAEQTPLIAAEAVRIFHEVGVPKEVLQLLPGEGAKVGARLVADQRVAAVIFTGSTETAAAINQTLATRGGPIVPLIAETGGQNAMIVDSTALPEQAVADIVKSAFGSAGQRCSALRLLFVQSDIAGKLLTMLQGAMGCLRVGDPALLATDIGPVIDMAARDTLRHHVNRMQKVAKPLYSLAVSPELLQRGSFFAPELIQLDSLEVLQREVFGPVLHVMTYQGNRLDQVIEAINKTGYGLTLGIHSRINETVEYIRQRVHVGNTYVNRNMIGAVVGVQPFGGEGLSGTGPKAGGPHYLQRLCVERTFTVNTAAVGGNASLVSLAD